MLKKLSFTVLGLVATIAIIVGVYVLMIRQLIAASAMFQPPPESVSIAEVRQEEWESLLSAVGTITAVQGTMISTEADGIVREITFTPGGVVDAGAVLVRLDADVEQSQLQAAEAAAELARANHRRSQELFQSRTISQAELDTAKAALQQAEAQIANIRAMIAKKTIVAPFAGRLGIRQISLGQYLNRGEPVVSLQSFDPVFVEFSLPQQHLARLDTGLELRVTTDAFAGETFTGRITALNPAVDPTTRNLRLQGTVPNPDRRLRPGLFATIDVVLPQKRQVLVVPVTAVLNSTSGDTVFVVEPGEPGPDGKAPSLVAHQRLVRTGEARGDFITIVQGLKAGERVVRAGGFKLRNGVAVVESDTGVPDASLEPKLKDS